MKKRPLFSALALASLAAAGVLASLAFAPAASAWSPTQLPPGWTVHHEVSNATTCNDAYRIFEYTAGVFKDVSPAFCLDSATYQQDFDAWIDARYTAPVTTAAPPPVTTTVVITTTTPADTTTTTVTQPPPDTTTTTPPPVQTSTVNVTTIVTTVSPVEQALQAQIDALTAQIAVLTSRVTRLEKAGDASWLAYQQAIAKGDDPGTAADIARGTWLNVVYGLGDFAP